MKSENIKDNDVSGVKLESETAKIILKIAAKKEYESERAADSDKLLRATAFLGVSAGMYIGSENLATATKDGLDFALLWTHRIGAVYLLLLSIVFLLPGHGWLSKFIFDRIEFRLGDSFLSQSRYERRADIYAWIFILPLAFITIFAASWPWS